MDPNTAAATLGYFILTKWGYQWLRTVYRDYWPSDDDLDTFSKKLLELFDAVKEEGDEFLETHVYRQVKEVQKHFVASDGSTVDLVEKVLDTEKKSLRIRKGLRTSFASAIAKRAYLKFGDRPLTRANILVTRRWLAKLFEEDCYKDMRTCDKIIAIDRALFLSFVPTNQYMEMQKVFSTGVVKDRMGYDEFGKVFRLGGPDDI